MEARPIHRRALALLAGVCLILLAQASSASADAKTLRTRAASFERQGDWDKACDTYEELLRLNRNASDIRERYRHCLRRLYQARRHLDPTYRKEVLSLKYAQALRLYEIVIYNLGEYALDKNKAAPERLFRKGLEELRHALADPVFLREHLRHQKPDDVKSFRARVAREFASLPIASHKEAVTQLREVAMLALGELRLNATTTILEFTCGACYAPDEYTTYLTPGQLSDLTSVLKGEVVGIGVKLARQMDKLVVADVLEDSPAGEKLAPMNLPALQKSDLLLAIDKKAVADLTPDLAQSLLEGEVGSLVELVVAAPGMPPRTVTLRRRLVFVPSVTYQLRSAAVGYVQITCFQESTAHELDLALAAITKAGAKALIVDLRGNPGGIFEIALEVTQRFLGAGVIVTKEKQDYKREVFTAQNPGALGLPLVLLVDGDTASTAEIVAGALKDHKRARLVGQTTFGKGSLQRVLPLPFQGQLKVPGEEGGFLTGGIRLTVARFFSPGGMPYTDRGVTPHLYVERRALSESMLDDLDPQLDQALTEVQRLLDAVR